MVNSYELATEKMKDILGGEGFDEIKDELDEFIAGIRSEEYLNGVESAAYYYSPGDSEEDNEMRLNQMSDIIDTLAPPYVLGKK